MSDIKILHKTARTLILNLREGLQQLERSESVPEYGAATGLSRQLQQKLTDLQRVSSQMESIWRMQVVKESAAKRDIWKRKVEQVSEETDALRTALDKHTGRQRRKQVEADQRQELLERRGGAADYLSAQRADAQGMSYISNSKQVIEEAFETGTAVLQSMSGQRERLKAAKTKALDVINSLGLSDSLLRVIERRQRLDKLITYGGMEWTKLCSTLVQHLYSLARAIRVQPRSNSIDVVQSVEEHSNWQAMNASTQMYASNTTTFLLLLLSHVVHLMPGLEKL